jgi:hypothetical protein
MVRRSPAAAAALSVATRFCSPALLNHCVRSYLWGVMYGRAYGIAFDDELYYVRALLHDLGLTAPFDSHRLAFEDAGGRLAWVFGVAAGWSEERAARADEMEGKKDDCQVAALQTVGIARGLPRWKAGKSDWTQGVTTRPATAAPSARRTLRQGRVQGRGGHADLRRAAAPSL